MGGRGAGDVVGGRGKRGKAAGNLVGGNRGPGALGREIPGGLGCTAAPAKGCRDMSPVMNGARLCSAVDVVPADWRPCNASVFFIFFGDFRRSFPQQRLHTLNATGIKLVDSGVSMRRRM